MDKYLSQLGISGPIVTIALYFLILAEVIKVGKIIWDFIAPKILGIQTTVSKEKKYRKQIEDNNIKINEYLDTQSEINKTTMESLRRIMNKVDTVSDDVIELKIEEMRQKLLDFASAVNDGRVYTKEQYNFILKLYTTYEEFIDRTGRTNDEVEISMEIIRSYYSYCVKHHCFVEDRLNDARIQSMLHSFDEKPDKNDNVLYESPKPKKTTKPKSNTKSKNTTQRKPQFDIEEDETE
jgi:hypothetical protein